MIEFFTVLGEIVGERLALVRPLPGYGINLAGSLAGIERVKVFVDDARAFFKKANESTISLFSAT